jgi:hypothetical protein
MADEMRVSFLLRSHFYYTSQLVNELIKLPGVDAGILGYDDGCDTAAEDGLSTEQAMRRFLDDPDSLSLMHADNTSTSSILSNLGIVKYIAGWVRKQNPDILHLHDSCDYRFWLTRLLTRKVCPMVLTVHDATDHPGDVYGRRVIFREKLRRMADNNSPRGCH